MIPPQCSCPFVYSSILNTGTALAIWRILKEPSVPEPAGERSDDSAKALQNPKKTAALDIGVCLLYRNGPHINGDYRSKQLFSKGRSRWRQEEGKREEKEEDKDRWGAREICRFGKKANPEGISEAFQAIYTMHLHVFLRNRKPLFDLTQYSDLSWQCGPGLETEMPQKCVKQPKAGCRSLNRDFAKKKITCTLTWRRWEYDWCWNYLLSFELLPLNSSESTEPQQWFEV